MEMERAGNSTFIYVIRLWEHMTSRGSFKVKCNIPEACELEVSSKKTFSINVVGGKGGYLEMTLTLSLGSVINVK